MKRSMKHGLASVDRVKAALDRAYKTNADRLAPFSPKMVWNGDRATVSLTMMMKTVSASFAVTADEVLVEGKIPFIFRHLEGKIMDALGEHLELAFAKAREERG